MTNAPAEFVGSSAPVCEDMAAFDKLSRPLRDILNYAEFNIDATTVSVALTVSDAIQQIAALEQYGFELLADSISPRRAA